MCLSSNIHLKNIYYAVKANDRGLLYYKFNIGVQNSLQGYFKIHR